MRPSTLRHSLVFLGICLFGAKLGLHAQDVHPVVRGTFESKLLLTGELVARDALNLKGPNVDIWPLRITWLAEDGSEVEAGEVVVQFDNSQLADSLEGLERKIIDARNQLDTVGAESESVATDPMAQ